MTHTGHHRSSNYFPKSVLVVARPYRECWQQGCCRQAYKEVFTASLSKVLPLRVLEGGTFATWNSDRELESLYLEVLFLYNLQTSKIQCPYCWETIKVVVDNSVPTQEYVEDCFVCCQPILLTIHIDAEGDASIEAIQENA